MNRRIGIKASTPRVDHWLLVGTLLLAGFGLIMVFSSSGIMAERFYGDKYFFFKKQTMFFVLGLGVMWLTARMPRAILYDLTYVWIAAAMLLLALCAFTPLGAGAGGARRWLHLGSVSIQPLEFAKLALAVYLAHFFARKQELVKTFSVGFLPPMLVTGVMCLLLLGQPDFGGAVFLAMIFFFMCLAGGTRLFYLLSSGIFGTWAGWMLISQSPYRLKRWTAFLNPFEKAKEEGYQLVQSLYSFGSGQGVGVGLGAGKQKLFFLPEAHNDFIMAVVGEELGFLGVSFVFLLIGVLIWSGLRVTWNQKDLRDRLCAFGMVLILTLGFLLNLAVVLGSVPPKGVPMPFVSYGGSSMLASFACVGILLNLSRKVEEA